MIVPAIGTLAGNLSEGIAKSVSGATSVVPGAQSSAALQEAGSLPGTGGVGGVAGTGAPGAATGGEATGFGKELTEAISSLEGTQTSGDGAAQALATGTTKDPESAVVTVEDAQMAMELAAQIRTKAAEAAQSIFQTQV